MTPFEKYFELKEKYGTENPDLHYPMTQYLTIVQMLSEEERSYKRHRQRRLKWMENIEKTIREIGERE